jgi:hypothetical protein
MASLPNADAIDPSRREPPSDHRLVLDGRPTIRIAAAATDRIEELVWKFRSLDQAARYLDGLQLLGIPR